MEEAFLSGFMSEMESLQKEAFLGRIGAWWKSIPFLTKAKWGLGLGVPAAGLAGLHAVSKGAASGRREAELRAARFGGGYRGY